MKKITSFSAAALWLRSGQALMCAIFLNNCFAQQQIQNVPQLGVSKIAAPSQPIQQMAIIQNQPQNQPPCLADEITGIYIQQQLQQNPNYQNLINKQNNQTQQLMQINAMAKAMVVRTIPVVVHVVYNTPQQNVSDAAIFNMLNILNEDFRRQNADTSNTRAIFKPVAADAQIEFCLASKDPSGMATNGITRTSTAEVNFDPDTETNKMKSDATNGKTGWDAFKYLNIWVCNITNGTGFGVVGYAYLPTPGMHGSSIDGLVIDYNRVNGRTATHEIGHYMGLKHTWGNNPPSCGNDDGFADTPNSSDENYGCSFSANTCATPTGDQIENYMSYANCQNMFSVDQANYMNSILSGVRSSLLSSDGCEPTAPPVANFIANVTTIQAGGYVWFTDLSTGVPDTWSWNFGGGGTPNTTAVRNPVIQFNTIGTYDVTLTVTNSLGSDNEIKSLYINVVAQTGCDTINLDFIIDSCKYVYNCGAGCGFVNGTNQYDDLAKAQLFTPGEYSPNTYVTGGLFYFAYAYKSGTSNGKVVFTVWDDNGVGGKPNTVLGTDTVDIADIVSDVQGNFLTQTLFASPVAVSGNYYYGYQMVNFDNWAGPTRDTLALVTSLLAVTPPSGNLAWEYSDLGTGYQWNDFPTAWGQNLVPWISPYMTNLPPTASFTADTTVGCDGLTVTFNAASSVNANEYYWDVDGDNAYDWWTIDTTLTITYDTTGIFSVTLLVVGPCTGLDSVKLTNYITINPNPSINTTKIDATCGSCNGSATANPSGGTTPYTYSWTDPLSQTSQTAGALCPGSYQVQVKDANGCGNVSGTTITDGAGLSASATATPDTCGNSVGTATVTVTGGSPGYNYSWSTSPVQTTVTATGLSAGTYNVTVTDINGCNVTTDFFSAAMVGNFIDTITIAFSSTGIFCNGDSNGTATAAPAGGTDPYTYSWNTSPVQTTATATGLIAGTYIVNVTDKNTCTVADTITLTQPTLLTASITSITNVSCFGGSNGSVCITPAGGTPSYFHSWSPSGQTTNCISGMSAGAYTDLVTDANGCDTTLNVTISQPPLLTVIFSGVVNVSCNGACDGSATPSGSGGTSPYTYSWGGGINLCAGTYNETVTDNNGCVATNSINITEPAPVIASVTISGNNTICAGDNVTFTATPANGGTPAYQWKVNGGNVGTNSATYSTTTLTNGNVVTCIMTSSLSCVTGSPDTSNAITMTVTSIPSSPGSITGPATPCIASVQTYSISAVTGATTYTWTVPIGWTINSGQGNTSINVSVGSGSGNVCVNAGNTCGTSAASCSAVTVNTTPATPGVVTGSTTPCAGTTQTCFITAVAGATSYTWTVPGGWTINSGQGSTAINVTVGVSSGNVCVSASNVCGTSAASCLAITVNTAPATPGSVTGTVSVCDGQAGEVYSISPVTGATSYTWTVPGSASITSGQGTTSITVTFGATSGNVCVTASNACGTSAASCTAVTVNPIVTASVTIAANINPICTGDTVTFTATPANGGTPAYQWKVNGGNVGVNSATYSTAILNDGDVITCIMASSLSCVTGSPDTSNAITMTVSASLPASVTISGNNTICAGDNVTFTATPANGGTPAYQWKVNGGNVGTNSATYTSSTLNNGDVVTCIMTSSLTCATGSPATSNAITMTVNTPVAVSVTITGNATICAGDNVTFTATPTNGGTPAYQWQVNGGNVGTNSSTYSTTTLNNGDVVTCIMTSSLTCATGSPATSNAITMTVTSISATPGIVTGTVSVCEGQAGEVYSISAVTGATSYTWTVPAGASITAGQGTTSITVTFGSASGNVCVTADNSCGTSAASCTAVTVTTSGAASVVIAASDDSICAGDNVTFTATPANEGTPTYQWQVNGGNVGTNSSTYSTATLNNGDVVTCIMTSSLTCATGSPATSNAITITVNSLPVINTTSMVVDSSSCGNSDGSITGITSTGTGALTYQWVNGSAAVVGTAVDLVNVPADTYTLTVTDASGCTDVEIVNMVNMAPCIPIGILEMDLANSLHLYPNPTKGVVLLEFTLGKPKDIKVTVYNIIGKVVSIAEWKNVASEIYRVNLSEKANGIYFLNIQTDDGVMVKKVSVVR